MPVIRLRWKLSVGLALAGVLAAASLTAWHVLRSKPAAAADDDPRLAYTTPYRNVRPDVAYVGSDRCTPCHAEHAANFRRHPMGRSLFPVEAAPPVEDFDPSGHDHFTAAGFEFAVDRADGRVVHREVKRDTEGRERAAVEGEVRYVLGSGHRGRSYLVDRDGFLVQSPISWYSEKHAWDLAPGYARYLRHFERPIQSECLFCHSGRANPVPGTTNRYERPAFAETAISCERCHGPGELHVRERAAGGAVSLPDLTIVNPHHLEPVLRDAVCEQCHLSGEVRVPRTGRQLTDYRPGLPLHLFVSIFVRAPEYVDDASAVGHVEQMHASRCFQASAGALGCTSCHDPHQSAPADRKADYFRDRCLKCHHDQGCRLPEPARRARGDDCVGCHMPRFASNLAHVATTDHKIRRRPVLPAHPPELGPSRPDGAPLVNFHQTELPADDVGAGRDLGIALMATYSPRAELVRARQALPLLEGSLERRPNDPAAREALGAALALAGRYRESLTAFEACLAQEPGRERALISVASACARTGRFDDAVDYWKRALAANPWASDTHLKLARTHAARQDWPATAAACRDALRLDPTNLDARKLLISCLAREKDWVRADRELDDALLFAPDQTAALRDWFADLAR